MLKSGGWGGGGGGGGGGHQNSSPAPFQDVLPGHSQYDRGVAAHAL